jgi:hypothetical protein
MGTKKMTNTAQLEQGSVEWGRARWGNVTGTGCSVLEQINQHRKPLEWLRENVRGLAGAPSEMVVVDAMRHGTLTEPKGIRWYENETGNAVRQTGLVQHPQYSFLKASPDGLVGFDGGIEIKCPFYAKSPYSVFSAAKEMYLYQCLFVMECCDLEWLDFVCFVDTKPKPIVTVERVNRIEGWLEQCVDGKLFPVPRKGRHRRVDLYQAWANHCHDEFQDVTRCKVHLDPLVSEAKNVTDDDDLNRIDELRGVVSSIEEEIGHHLTKISDAKAEMDSLKKIVASRYESSVTNGSTLVQVVAKTPPIDYRAAFEFLGGEQTLIDRNSSLEEFRRTTNTRQISIKKEGDH